jgi:hypothetical protein
VNDSKIPYGHLDVEHFILDWSAYTAISSNAMQTDSHPHGPLYIYNGPANLQELECVNLTDACIFFNGSYSLRDLRNVNFMGATVFINGQQAVKQDL